MILRLIYLLIFIGSLEFINAQTSIDSLETLLSEASESAQKAELLIELGQELNDIQKLDTALMNIDEAFVLLKSINDTTLLGKALLHKGSNFYYRAKLDSAQFYYKKCIDLFGEKTNSAKGPAYHNLGNIAVDKGQFKESLPHYAISLELAQEDKDSLGIAHTFQSMGIAYYYLGNYQKCIDFFIDSKDMMEELGDQSGVADALNNIAAVYQDLEEYKKSHQYFMQSMELDSILENKAGVALSQNNIGNNYIYLSDFKQAEYYLSKAEVYFKEDPKEEKMLASNYLKQAQVQMKQDNFDAALPFLLKTIPIFEKLDAQQYLAEANISIGKCYLSLNKIQKSIPHLEKGEQIANEIEAVIEKNNAYNGLGTAYGANNQYQKAYEYQKKHSELNEQLLKERTTTVKARLSEMEMAEKEKKIQFLNQEKEIDRLELKDQAQSIKLQRVGLGLTASALLFFCSLAFQLFRSRRQKQEELNLLQVNEKALLEKNNVLENSQNELKQQRQKLNNQYQQSLEDQKRLEQEQVKLSEDFSTLQAANLALSVQLEEQKPIPSPAHFEEKLYQLNSGDIIKIGEICYLQSDSNYINFTLVNGEILRERNTLINLQKELPEELFLKIHRSYIVNILQVKTVQSNRLEMKNGDSITLSATGKKLINKVLKP